MGFLREGVVSRCKKISKLFRSDERCVVAPHLRAKVQDLLKEQRLKNVPRSFAMAAVLLMFFLVRPGSWEGADNKFIRVNNVLNLLEISIIYLGVRLKCRFIIDFYDAALFLSMLHSICYLTMSGARIAKLYSFFQVSIPYDESEDDAYYLLMSLVAIFLCGQAHVVQLRYFFIITLFAICSWVAQISLLYVRSPPDMAVRQGVAYCALCCSAYIGMQQSVQLWESEFVRRNTERTSIMHTLQHASMPIAVIDSKPEVSTSDGSSSTPLRVTLWSDGFEALTSVGIPSQRECFLEDLSCFRMQELQCLEAAIRRALGKERASSKQMILPAVVTHGVVWLQIDVWPLVLSDDLKVIIMGSNVTEWVERHSSLLRSVNDEHPTSDFGRIPDKIHAIVNGDSLILTKCSPDFNLLFSRPVEGLSVLDLVASAEERCRMSYVITEVMGDRISRSITLHVKPHPFKPRSRGKIHRKPAPSHRSYRCLNFWVSMWGENNDEVSGGLQLLLEAVEVATDHNENMTRSAASPISPHVASLVPEHAECSFSEPAARLEERGRAVLRRTKSDPGQRGEDAASSVESGSGDSFSCAVVLEAVASSIVEYTRHFGVETFKDSQVVLWRALRLVGTHQEMYSLKWGKACNAWNCSHCQASNDSDDVFCEVCKMENESLASSSVGNFGGVESLDHIEQFGSRNSTLTSMSRWTNPEKDPFGHTMLRISL